MTFIRIIEGTSNQRYGATKQIWIDSETIHARVVGHHASASVGKCYIVLHMKKSPSKAYIVKPRIICHSDRIFESNIWMIEIPTAISVRFWCHLLNRRKRLPKGVRWNCVENTTIHWRPLEDFQVLSLQQVRQGVEGLMDGLHGNCHTSNCVSQICFCWFKYYNKRDVNLIPRILCAFRFELSIHEEWHTEIEAGSVICLWLEYMTVHIYVNLSLIYRERVLDLYIEIITILWSAGAPLHLKEWRGIQSYWCAKQTKCLTNKKLAKKHLYPKLIQSLSFNVYIYIYICFKVITLSKLSATEQNNGTTTAPRQSSRHRLPSHWDLPNRRDPSWQMDRRPIRVRN